MTISGHGAELTGEFCRVNVREPDPASVEPRQQLDPLVGVAGIRVVQPGVDPVVETIRRVHVATFVTGVMVRGE